MNDFAALGIKVETSSVKSGAQELDKLVASAKKAESATQSLEDGAKKSGKAAGDAGKAFEQAKPKVDGLNQSLQHGALSAKQYAAAMRFVPMQVTDIVTQLAGGQSPFLVMLQQGGQLRDSFGGIGNALRALGSMITPFRLAMLGAAAAVGTFAKAMLDVEQEQKAFQLALSTTNNAAGLTAARLEEIVRQAEKLSGISLTNARKVAVQLAQTGRFSDEVIGNMTRSVQTFAAVTGQEVDKAAQSLAKVFSDPAAGAEQLNQQFHFLSAAQLKYIQQLHEQGRVEDAQRVASEQFADFIDDKYVESLGSLERAWHGVSQAIGQAWEGLKSIGRENISAQIAELDAYVKKFEPRLANQGAFSPLHGEVARAKAELERLQRIQQEESFNAAFSKGQADKQARVTESERFVKGITDSLKTDTEKYQEERKKLVDAYLYNVIKDDETFRRLDDALQARFGVGGVSIAGGALFDPSEMTAASETELSRVLDAQMAADHDAWNQRNDTNDFAQALRDRGDERAALQNELSVAMANDAKEREQGLNATLDRHTEHFKEKTNEMSEYWKSAQQNMQSSFADFLLKPMEDGLRGLGKSFVQIFRQMAAQAASAKFFTALFGGERRQDGSTTSGALTGVGSFLSSLFGFADGGSFKVGGGGGTDSQLVAFRASPDETVSITKPGQGMGGLVFAPVWNVDARGSSMTRAEFEEIVQTGNVATFNAVMAQLANDRRRGRY